ncbi:geranyltranstransferase family protein [Peptostreptococcaceae bacterium oral taxon 113 str. W5053]|nr:geranyltranstransferase family protein [Peptostreptococcaceae bacterium oral taxon 113 str. W5053]
MIFLDELNKKRELIEENLNQTLIHQLSDNSELLDIARYAVLNGGKRIRPILLMETFQIFKKNNDKEALPFAIAIELIHNYSLIHDDLPCMDDDDYRRGQFTVHKKYGEANGVLAGDLLLNLAYEIIAKELFCFSMKNKIKAFQIIAKAAGIAGMVGGQFLDINKNVDTYEELEMIYHKKTGALIQAAVLAGAYLGGANESDIKKMEKFGQCLGMAFQLRDDMLDWKTGDKLNADLFLSKEECEKLVEKYSKTAIESIFSLENKEISFLHKFTEFLINRAV